MGYRPGSRQTGGHARSTLIALFAGLWLYGFSMAMMITAGLGLDPWDVFHQALPVAHPSASVP